MEFDANVPNTARMWNYWLGGKDNFTADRAAAEQIIDVLPSMPLVARGARQFLTGAVHQLVTAYGVRQFLDIGSGLPTADNTHEVAQRADPAARVVYVDHDPVVLSHARALLSGTPEGKTEYIQADLRDTAAILAGARRTLDFDEPVAVLLIAVLHFVPDADNAYGVVRRLADAIVSGSYLVIGHGASDIEPAAAAELSRRYNAMSPTKIRMRSRAEVSPFFDGLEPVGPGLVPLAQWRESGLGGVDAAGTDGAGTDAAGTDAAGTVAAMDAAAGLVGYVGMARKP